jgi:hypothetical protein
MAGKIPVCEKTLEFVSFCIEIYAAENNISGREAAELFERHGVIDWLFECYDALHTQGKGYILSAVNEFLDRRK